MDHSVKENHNLDWERAKIVEKEREDLAQGITEFIYIQKLPNFNRDEGRYHLSHLYDNLLGARRTGRAKTTEVGTVQSPPCSNPFVAVMCHNHSPEEVTLLVMKIWHVIFYCLSLNELYDNVLLQTNEPLQECTDQGEGIDPEAVGLASHTKADMH